MQRRPTPSDFRALPTVPRASDPRLSRVRVAVSRQEPGPNACSTYILVMVKLPDPAQPELPVRVHVPVIVFPVTAPVRAKVLPVGVEDCTVIPNLPLTLPLKFPLNVNDPLSLSDAKHGELVVKLKFVMFNDPSWLTVIDVPNANTEEFPPLVRLAFHVPLTVLELELLPEPQPISTRPTTTTTATANCFIRNPLD